MPSSSSSTNSLPLEIIEQITNFLPLSDRLSCILTCKTWYSQLYRSIIRIVHISKRRQLKQFLHHLQKYNDIGLEIREFYLESRVGLTPSEFVFFSKACPLLEVFKFSHWQNYKSNFFTPFKNLKQIPKLHDPPKATSAIKEVGATLIHLEIHAFLLRRIVPRNEHYLMLNATPNLTHLTLDGIFNPSPERLDIGRMQFDCDSWNALHVYCRHLEYINIKHAFLEAPTTPTQHNQMHAASSTTMQQPRLKHLILKSLNLLHPGWLYHFAFKYPNLIELELAFSLGTFCNYDESIHLLDQVDCQTGFLMLAHELKKLHTLALRGLKTSHFPGRIFFSLMLTKGVQLRNVTVLYNTDDASLPGITASTLSALALGQNKTLESLEIEVPCGITLNGEDKFYTTVIRPLETCTRLTRLTLGNDDYTTFNYNSVALDSILNTCPQLEELSMARFAIHIQDKYTKRVQHKLKRFDLGVSRVSQSLFEYLTIRCPHITHMTIISCCWMPRELKMSICMPNNTFEYLRVADMNRRKVPGLEGNLLHGQTVNLFSVSQLDKEKKKRCRYRHSSQVIPMEGDDCEEFLQPTWYYLYEPPPSTRFYFPPSFIRKLSQKEIQVLDYILEFYTANNHLAKARSFQEYENRYLGKKQWKFDVASGFVSITCKSVKTLKYNFNVIQYK